MSLKVTLSQHHAVLQGELFPLLESKLSPLPPRYQRFVELMEFVFVDLSVFRVRRQVRVGRWRTVGRGRFWPRRCSMCRRRGP